MYAPLVSLIRGLKWLWHLDILLLYLPSHLKIHQRLYPQSHKGSLEYKIPLVELVELNQNYYLEVLFDLLFEEFGFVFLLKNF